jgi:hypothetical protein
MVWQFPVKEEMQPKQSPFFIQAVTLFNIKILDPVIRLSAKAIPHEITLHSACHG